MAKNNQSKQPSANQLTVPQQLDNWVFYSLLAIAFLLPLVMSRPIWVTFDQFDITKILFLRLLTLFAVILWIGKILTSRKNEVRWTKLDFVVLGFLALVIISTFTSLHLPTAVHGKYKRFEGLLTFLNYGILYFLAIQAFTNAKRLSRLGTVITIAGVFISIYGVLQYLGLDPLKWSSLPFEERRSFSTFGNPDLLAGFLVMLVPVTVAEFFRSKEIKDRTRALFYDAFVFFAYIIAVLCFFFALTRGAWLGGLAAMLAFIVIAFGAIRKHPVKASLVFGIFIVIFIVAATYTAAVSAGGAHLLERIQSVTKVTEGSAGSRLEIWKAGAQMIKTRPLFGWGPDMFRLASEKFETFRYAQMGGGRTVADNAHNYVIQIAGTIGVPAAIILFGFFIAVLFVGVRATLKLPESERFVSAGLTTAVLGYCVHLLFGISISGSTSVFWLMLGAIVASSSLVRTAQIFSRQTGDVSLKVAAVVIALISLVSAYYGIRIFRADQHYAQAIQLGNSGNLEMAFGEYQKAIDLYQNGRYYDSYGLLLERAGVARQSLELINRAVEIYREGIDAEPYDMDHYVSMAGALAKTATGPSDPVLNDAASRLEYAIENVRPNSFPAHMLLGNIYLYQGRYKEAVNMLEFALKVKPQEKAAIQMIAEAYKELGMQKEAKKYYKQLLTMDPNNQEAKAAISSIDN
ncbi:MAG: O-antigen ligase family protein [Firmicutes bacterium]|nr:O-antigen ligase family protein [Bacillota bacterium]